jgi:hypothetical protein
MNRRHNSKVAIALIDRDIYDCLADVLDEAARPADDDFLRYDFQIADEILVIQFADDMRASI